MKKRKTKAIEFKKFDGLANKTSFSEIKKNLFNCERIDVIPKEMIVKLNIRWGELYCVCNNEEWAEFYKILKDNGIQIKKRGFLDLIFDILDFFFVQPVELTISFLKKIMK